MNKIYNYLLKLNDSTSISWFEYLLFFAFIFMGFYYGFASYALENMNEGLYAEIAREMLVTGNYIVPQLNFVPYLEKPPMLYWLISISYHLFGVSAFAARLIPVTAAALTCVATLLFAKSMRLSKAGWMAGIILATGVGFIVISRVIIFDMLLTFFFVSALFSFYLWYEKSHRPFLWLAYAFLGCAFLTKGLVAIALGFSIAFLFMLINKTDKVKIYRFFDLIGIGIFLAITVPWLILASIKQPGFASDFFINEQIMRFLNKRFPHDYHTGSVFYYIIPLLVIFIPWSMFLPTLIKRTPNADSKTKSLQKFLWLWFLLVLIFFSISKAKAHYYIVIGIPPITLLLGIKLSALLQQAHNKTIEHTFKTLVIIGLSILAITCLSIYNSSINNWLPEKLQLPYELLTPLSFMLITMLIYVSFALIINHFFKIPWLQFVLFACLIIPGIFFLQLIKQQSQSNRSEISLGQYIVAHDPQRPLYLYRDFETISSIIFYSKNRARIIDSLSKDLYFGSTTPQAQGWFVTTPFFIDQAKKRPVYLVIKNTKLAQFNAAMLPLKFCQLSRSGTVLLLSNVCD